MLKGLLSVKRERCATLRGTHDGPPGSPCCIALHNTLQPKVEVVVLKTDVVVVAAEGILFVDVEVLELDAVPQEAPDATYRASGCGGREAPHQTPAQTDCPPETCLLQTPALYQRTVRSASGGPTGAARLTL